MSGAGVICKSLMLRRRRRRRTLSGWRLERGLNEAKGYMDVRYVEETVDICDEFGIR